MRNNLLKTSTYSLIVLSVIDKLLLNSVLPSFSESRMSAVILLAWANVLSCLESDLNAIKSLFLSRVMSSNLAASSIIRSTYPRTARADASMGLSINCGQPPRTVNSISFLREISPVIVVSNSSSNIPFREIFPEESPDSYNDIVRNLRTPILPAPLCLMPLIFGVDEPVSMNCPLPSESSTMLFVASHISGMSCHSSIRCGLSPSKMILISTSANLLFMKLFLGSASMNALLELFKENHVFPQPLGPSTQTAPNASRYVLNSSSIMRLR